MPVVGICLEYKGFCAGVKANHASVPLGCDSTSDEETLQAASRQLDICSVAAPSLINPDDVRGYTTARPPDLVHALLDYQRAGK
jgi:hypothetical protein